MAEPSTPPTASGLNDSAKLDPRTVIEVENYQSDHALGQVSQDDSFASERPSNGREARAAPIPWNEGLAGQLIMIHPAMRKDRPYLVHREPLGEIQMYLEAWCEHRNKSYMKRRDPCDFFAPPWWNLRLRRLLREQTSPTYRFANTNDPIHTEAKTPGPISRSAKSLLDEHGDSAHSGVIFDDFLYHYRDLSRVSALDNRRNQTYRHQISALDLSKLSQLAPAEAVQFRECYHKIAVDEKGRPTEPGGFYIVVARNSGAQDEDVVVSEMLSSPLVLADFEAQRPIEEVAFNLAPLAPRIHTRHIVINGVSAIMPVHIYAHADSNEGQLEFLHALEEADQIRPRPDVYIVIRGIEGLSCAPRTWGRFAQRFPNLHVWLIFALRAPYLARRLELLAAVQGHPFPAAPYVSAQTAGGLFFTDAISARDLHHQDDIAFVHNDLQEIIRLQAEGYAARAGGMTDPDSEIVLGRGRGRNRYGV